MRVRYAVLVASLSCVVLSASQPEAAAQPEAPAQPEAQPFVGGELDQDTILSALSNRYPRSFRPVGTSSVTMRVDLGNIDAAFKPRTDSHPRGYLSEIAAYRIARFLRMDNVPPVITRRVPRVLFQSRFQSPHPEDWEPVREEIRWDVSGVTPGATIYWIPSMRSSELSTDAGVRAVADWLRIDGEIPEGSEGLAQDLSTLFAFDYLIGNWDRLSGGNVSATRAGDRLFIRDHNVAFTTALNGPRYGRIRNNLERVQRFSREFIRRIEAMDEAAIGAALAEDPESEVRPILTPGEIENVLARRRALLSYVGALVSVHGAEHVFVW